MDPLQILLDELLEDTELQVSQSQRVALIDYVNFLHKWNKAYNLTSVRDPKEMLVKHCLLYTSPSPRDGATSRMPSSA